MIDSLGRDWPARYCASKARRAARTVEPIPRCLLPCLAQGGQSKDLHGKTVVDDALPKGYPDAPCNTAPSDIRLLQRNSRCEVDAVYDRFGSSASTKRLNS